MVQRVPVIYIRVEAMAICQGAMLFWRPTLQVKASILRLTEALVHLSSGN